MLEVVPTNLEKDTVCIDFLLICKDEVKLARFGRAGFAQHTHIRLEIVVGIAMSN